MNYQRTDLPKAYEYEAVADVSCHSLAEKLNAKYHQGWAPVPGMPIATNEGRLLCVVVREVPPNKPSEFDRMKERVAEDHITQGDRARRGRAVDDDGAEKLDPDYLDRINRRGKYAKESHDGHPTILAPGYPSIHR